MRASIDDLARPGVEDGGKIDEPTLDRDIT